MSDKDKREMQIEDMIFDLLVSFGISPTLRGFKVLEYCIKDFVLRPREITTMELYYEVAEKNRERWENISRAVRFAIGKAINAVGVEGIKERIGEIAPLKGRLEPIVFMRNCARKIRGQIA